MWLRDDVLHRTMEAVYYLLELFEGDALLPILQSQQAGGRHSQLPCKYRIGHFSSPFTKEKGKMQETVQTKMQM